MLVPTVAILMTIVHGVLAWRSRSSLVTMTVPILTVGIGAACAAAAGLREPMSGGVSAAELIVAPVVLLVIVGSVRLMCSGSGPALRVWPLAGLVFLLGGLSLADRVDALNAQLLLVLSLGVLWVLGSRESQYQIGASEFDSPGSGEMPTTSENRLRSTSLATSLFGLIAAALAGWAMMLGVDARLALGLVAVNLLIWSIGVRDLAVIAVTGEISIGVGVGGANIVRVIGGAMAQPEWAAGQRSQAIGLEIASRPYIPGFGATLPDIVLLVIGVLLVILASESPGAATRRWLTAGLLMGLAGAQMVWMWIGAG